jgi:hypothetical protein
MSWLGPIKQISYTTDDLHGLIDFWETQVGVGPWSVFRNITRYWLRSRYLPRTRHPNRPSASFR